MAKILLKKLLEIILQKSCFQ